MSSGATIVDATFTENTAVREGGGALASDDASVSNATFEANVASRGGGLYVSGATSTFSRLTFLNNETSSQYSAGGAIYSYQSAATFVDIEARGNVASGGGGFYAVEGSPTVVNGLFVANVAERQPGSYSSAQDGLGGAFYLEGTEALLVNTTVTGNVAREDGSGSEGGEGGGVYVVGDDTSVLVRNVILWGNDADGTGDDLLAVGTGQVLLAHSLIDGGVPEGELYFDGGGNLDASPGFADPVGPDGQAGTDDDDYRLGPNSAALDAGDSNALPLDLADLDGDDDTAERLPLDLADAARVQGATVDIGAYEGAQANTAPIAVADVAETDEDVSVTIDAAANDTDPDGDAVTVASVSDPAAGTAVVDADGQIVYTPDPDAFGVDTFTYVATDGTASARGTVTVTVVNVNDPPTAGDDSFVVSESGDRLEVFSNDSDPDGGTLAFETVSDPDNGSIQGYYTQTPYGQPTRGYIEYDPDDDFFGTDTFTYTVRDEDGGLATATVTVEVNGRPRFEYAVDPEAVVDEPYELAVTATDPDGDPITLSAGVGWEMEPLPSWLSFVDNGDGTGLLSGTPTSADLGTFRLYVQASDGTLENDYSFELSVRRESEANRPPVAVDDAYTTEEDQPLGYLPLVDNDSDPDGDPLRITSTSDPDNGSVFWAGQTYVSYTPDDDFFGTDTFTYTISDGEGGTATATVTVTVEPVNDIPYILSGPPAQAVVGEAYRGTVTVQDVDGDALALTTDQLPSWLSFVDNGDGTGTLRGTPGPYDEGLFRVTVRADDGTLEASRPFDIAVTGDGAPPPGTDPEDTPPTVAPDVVSTAEDSEVTVRVLRNDTDPQGGRPSLVAVTRPSHGEAFADGDGTVTYVPGPDYHGSDYFTYSAHANNGRVATGQVAVTVQPVNDAPDAAPDAFETDEDETLVVEAPGLLANDADAEGQSLRARVAQPPPTSQGTVSVSPRGGFEFQPAPDFDGETSFTYAVRDEDGGESVGTVTVRVAGTNDAPEAPVAPARPVPDAILDLTSNGELVVDWSPVTDPDGDVVSYVWELALDDETSLLTVAGSRPPLFVSHDAIGRALADAGVGTSADVAVRHRVTASDGSLMAEGAWSAARVRSGAATASEGTPMEFAVVSPRPNPTRGRARVALDLPWAAEVRVEVFDVTGRRVADVRRHLTAGPALSFDLDLTSLPSGLYALRVSATHGAGVEHKTSRVTIVR